MLRSIFALGLCTVLGACATAYQPQGFSGGFSESRLDANVFRVTFSGNAYTSADRVEEMVLLRSAELALQNGFTHFAVVDGATRTSTSTFTAPTQAVTTGSASVMGNTIYGNATTTTTGGQTFVFKKPSTVNTIVCFVGKPNISGLVYDAQFLVGSLGPKYGMKGNLPVQTVAAAPVTAVAPEPPARATGRDGVAVAIVAPIQRRPMAVRWDGYASLISGTLELQDGSRRGSISASLPDGTGRCSGTFEYSSPTGGVWSVACTNNMSASGTFEVAGQRKGSSGRGRDTKGNAVEFTVGEAL